MPYTVALIDFPRLPSAQSKLVNPDGTMATEWVTFFTELRRWAEKHGLALVQLTPP